MGVVSESSGVGFAMLMVLESFGLVLWPGWRMALWCLPRFCSIFSIFQFLLSLNLKFTAFSAHIAS